MQVVSLFLLKKGLAGNWPRRSLRYLLAISREILRFAQNDGSAQNDVILSGAKNLSALPLPCMRSLALQLRYNSSKGAENEAAYILARMGNPIHLA